MLHLPPAWRNEGDSVTQDHLRLRLGVCGVSEHAILCLTIKKRGRRTYKLERWVLCWLKETQILHKRHLPHVAE